MEAYLLSLALTLAISLASLVPGAIDARLATDLQTEARKQLGAETVVHAHVQGDPVLQLPWGVVPHLAVDLEHIQGWGFPVSRVHVELDDVHVSPWAVLAHQPPKLLAPAPARVEVRLARANLQAMLDLALAKIKPADFAFDLPLLGHVQPVLSEAHVLLEGNRVGVTGQVRLKEGAAPRTFAASIGLAVKAGKYLVPVDPRLSLGTQGIPSFLLGPLTKGLAPLLTLQDLHLRESTWTMDEPRVLADGVTLRIHGTVDDFKP
ncbi:MAG: hypothetical protein JWM80_2585 [Cyanobacteria bacterium RYN_339]|nr:hypothetical protein [Cyanobacteria bacterium RYN_339]